MSYYSHEKGIGNGMGARFARSDVILVLPSKNRHSLTVYPRCFAESLKFGLQLEHPARIPVQQGLDQLESIVAT